MSTDTKIHLAGRRQPRLPCPGSVLGSGDGVAPPGRDHQRAMAIGAAVEERRCSTDGGLSAVAPGRVTPGQGVPNGLVELLGA